MFVKYTYTESTPVHRIRYAPLHIAKDIVIYFEINMFVIYTEGNFNDLFRIES